MSKLFSVFSTKINVLDFFHITGHTAFLIPTSSFAEKFRNWTKEDRSIILTRLYDNKIVISNGHQDKIPNP